MGDSEVTVMDTEVTAAFFFQPYFRFLSASNEAASTLPLLLPSRLGQNIAFPPVALWVTVGLAVCLLVLLIALAAVCRRKIKESCEEARREGEASGGEPCQLSAE